MMCRPLSRRPMLVLGALIFGGSGCPAMAQRRKLSQSDAGYGKHRCEACFNFQAPNGCKFVEGEISPRGWCKLFAAKSS